MKYDCRPWEKVCRMLHDYKNGICLVDATWERHSFAYARLFDNDQHFLIALWTIVIVFLKFQSTKTFTIIRVFVLLNRISMFYTDLPGMDVNYLWEIVTPCLLGTLII